MLVPAGGGAGRPVAFVLHSGAGAWDAAPRGGGTFYTAAGPGVYALRDGRLSAVARCAELKLFITLVTIFIMVITIWNSHNYL